MIAYVYLLHLDFHTPRKQSNGADYHELVESNRLDFQAHALFLVEESSSQWLFLFRIVETP